MSVQPITPPAIISIHGRILVPLVVVFTKLDKLHFREKQRLKKEYKSKGQSLQEATTRAQEEYLETSKVKYTESCLKILNSIAVLKGWARHTFVSIKRKDISAHISLRTN